MSAAARLEGEVLRLFRQTISGDDRRQAVKLLLGAAEDEKSYLARAILAVSRDYAGGDTSDHQNHFRKEEAATRRTPNAKGARRRAST